MARTIDEVRKKKKRLEEIRKKVGGDILLTARQSLEAERERLVDDLVKLTGLPAHMIDPDRG